jgi:hypothetical protein
VEPLALDWYNACLPPEAAASAIPPQSPAGATALVLLVGNSAAIWRPFVAACAADPSLLASLHPLETYMERCIDNSLLPILASLGPRRLFWSHSQATLAGGKRGFVAMQRMAECCGMAYLDHTSHLSMHPSFGPWFSLRCCIILDSVRWEASPPPPLPCPLTPAQHANVKTAAEAAFGRADGDSALLEIGDVRTGWELWLAVRIAAAPGHAHKYNQQQILYHYTGNRDILRAAAAAMSV